MTWRTTVATLLVAAAASAALAEAPEMAALAPADAAAIVEFVDAAGLRAMLLESKFWAALQQTEAARTWQASPRHQQMRERVSRFLERVRMTEDEALRTYLGGRSAVVLLPGADKPQGVLLVEAANDMAQRLIDATGGQQAGRYRDVTLWEVRKENRVDRMAIAGGVMLVSGAEGNALERVLDAIVGGGASLAAQGTFAQLAGDLPPGWRVRSYAARMPPHQRPAAAALYPQEGGRAHLEWRLPAEDKHAAMTAPVKLAAPGLLPAETVAALATALHPAAIWAHAQAEAQASQAAQERLRKAEMFIQAWFPGHKMDSITASFGPEGCVAILKGAAGGLPAAVALARIREGGQPAATSFRDGLAAKAMLLAAMAPQNQEGPKINVREENYGGTSLLVIEAPGALLKQVAGRFADQMALTVAVTADWLIVGTTSAAVKQVLDTAAGQGTSLVAALQAAGETVPEGPVTHWGVVEPARAAEVVTQLSPPEAEGAARLAELMGLIERFTWQRTDGPDLIRGRAEVQAID